MKWLKNFMYNKYGIDQFGLFLFYSYFITVIVSLWVKPVLFLSYALLIYTLFRMFSKKYDKRRKENSKYLYKTRHIRKYLRRQKNRWTNRKTYKYFKCPSCHQHLRAPKGKGTITITCSKCHTQFDKKT